jgi:hypothetical protein
MVVFMPYLIGEINNPELGAAWYDPLLIWMSGALSIIGVTTMIALILFWGRWVFTGKEPWIN